MDLSNMPMPKRGGPAEDPVMAEDSAPGKAPDLSAIDDESLMKEMENRGFTVSKGEAPESESPKMAAEEEDLFPE